MDYRKFLKGKELTTDATGFESPYEYNPALFDFQLDCVRWALRRGAAALFLDCGSGKAITSLIWSEHVHKFTDKNVIIFAPLAVSLQTVREGEKFGVDVNLCKTQDDVKPGINITNYERLHNFDMDQFASPGSNEYSEGIYEYEAKLLRGARTPFQEIKVNTLNPMDTKKLYLLCADQLHPTELLPFFRIMESPSTQQNACYFYNRLKGDNVRWISYHFEDEAEIIRSDDEVMSAISLLRPKDRAQE